MKNTKNKILVASAVAIMMAPAALNALPQQTINADAIGTVSTATPVYDANGKTNGTTLPSGSQWKLGQQITLNGVAHYQVGNNEYVPASVITNVTGATNSVDTSVQVGRWVSDNPDAGKTATANTLLHVVDVYGNDTGITLASGSQWKIGEILHANKMMYYQVGQNEYVPVTDVAVANASTSTTDQQTTTQRDSNYGRNAKLARTAQVYDGNGKALSLDLPANSEWKLGNYMKIGNIEYYQVATNEWIMSLDIASFDSVANPNVTNGSYIVASSVAGQTGRLNHDAEIVNGMGTNTGRTLAKGSEWKLGKDMLSYDKQTFYQVGNGEYISTAYTDIVSPKADTNKTKIPTPGKGLVGTTKVALRTYNTATNSYDLSLPANSSWKISKLVVNKYGSYWGQVATNQWVWITNVNLNSGLSLKDNADSEPSFATNIKK